MTTLNIAELLEKLDAIRINATRALDAIASLPIGAEKHEVISVRIGKKIAELVNSATFWDGMLKNELSKPYNERDYSSIQRMIVWRSEAVEQLRSMNINL